MMQFDHLGVFVKSLDEGLTHFHKMFHIKTISDEFHDPLLKVSVQLLVDSSGIRYETVAPNGLGNPVDAVLRERKNILNHVAYRTDEFENELVRLRAEGCLPLGKPVPAVAFDGSRVVFLLTPLRLILEIIENPR
jgi:methylmalonyl-CoA/ethylmalonyl-CoA epimerase